MTRFRTSLFLTQARRFIPELDVRFPCLEYLFSQDEEYFEIH